MKKTSIIVLLIVVLFTGCNSNINDNKEAKTLTEFIKNHDSKHMGCAGDGCGDLNFVVENFKCSDISNKTIIYMDRNNIITDDYMVYDITLDSGKIFSNNQQCIKKDLGLDIEDIYIYRYDIVLKSNNKLYKWQQDGGDGRVIMDFCNDCSYSTLLKDGYDIIYDSYNKCEYLIAIKDGDVYKLEYCEDPSIISNKSIILSKENYGNIKSANYTGDLYRYKKSYIEIEPQVTKMVTDNGIYVLKEKETDECIKYEDIKCELKLELSDVYLKYKDNIKYLGLDYAILDDNNVVSTSVFFASVN
jgi:hypothetical protein